MIGYGFKSDAEAMAYTGNPITDIIQMHFVAPEALKDLAAAKVPLEIRHVFGMDSQPAPAMAGDAGGWLATSGCLDPRFGGEVCSSAFRWLVDEETS